MRKEIEYLKNLEIAKAGYRTALDKLVNDTRCIGVPNAHILTAKSTCQLRADVFYELFSGEEIIVVKRETQSYFPWEAYVYVDEFYFFCVLDIRTYEERYGAIDGKDIHAEQ